MKMYALLVVILSSVFLTSCFGPDESEDQQPDTEAQPEFPVASDEELFVLAAHQGETDELIKKAEELATKEDSDLEDKLNLANAYLQKGSLDLQERLYSDKAKKIINEVIELDHENARAYQLLGYAHEIVEEYKESEAAYLRSISLDVGDSMTQQMLAHMYWLTGDIESAKKHYGRALEFSRDVLSLSGLANILMNEGDISGASKLLEEIVQQADYVTTPKRTLSDTYSTLGLIERSQDNIDEAIKMFAKAVETDGSNDLPRTNLAYTKFFQVFYADQDDDRNTILLTDEIYAAADENLPAIDEAIALNPTRTHNYVSKTEILYAVRLLDLALGSARRGLRYIDEDITLNPHGRELQRKYIQELIEIITTEQSTSNT